MDDRTFHDLVDAIERGEAVPDGLTADEAALLAVAQRLFAARALLPATLGGRRWPEQPARPDGPAHWAVPTAASRPHRHSRRAWRQSWLPEAALLGLLALIALLVVWAAGRPAIVPGGSATPTPTTGPRNTPTAFSDAETRWITPTPGGLIGATNALTGTTAATPTPGTPAEAIWALTVAGDRAYAAVHVEGMGAESRLDVLDVADPAAPRRLSGTTLTASAIVSNIAIDGDTAYVAGTGGLRVVDVGDPTQPREVGVVTPEVTTAYPPPPISVPSFIAVRGDRVYGANRRGGVMIFGVAQPTQPRFVREIALPGDSQAHDLAVHGDVLLVADGAGGLFTFSLADPDRPRLLATVPGTLANPVTYSSLAVIDDHVLVITSTPGEGRVIDAGSEDADQMWQSGLPQRVVSLNVADPAQPRRDGSVDLPWPVFTRAVLGDRLIVASDGGRDETFLSAIDATAQAAPTQIARVPGQVFAMAAAGPNLLVAGTGHDGLRVLSLADMAHPTWLGQSPGE